ncbi:M23 family metallopeptidase [Candidatus Dojkabacteria bacterium]|nr:M23 family metallopeptidase [Candidatus Dojkabacteria bacterium]
MKRTKFSLNKKYLERFLNFPVFVFVIIILLSVISVFGARWITGQRGPGVLQATSENKCYKLGVNGGGFPNEEVFQKMEGAGFHWYQGLVIDEGGGDAIVSAIKTASKYDIKVIVRICYGDQTNWVCPGFDPRNGNAQNAAQNYIDMLNYVAERVDTDFWAIAGHNEPNAGEYLPEGDERAFMEHVINGMNNDKIHLLSPIMDLHARDTEQMKFQNYLDSLGRDNLDRLWGIAGNTYEFPNAEDKITKRVQELESWLQGKNLGHKPIIVTETGPFEPSSLESFKSSYNTIIEDSKIQAALIFKPQGLGEGAQHITWDQSKTVVPECSGENSDVIIECAFMDNRLQPCESEGHLGMGRGLVLEYRGSLHSELWVAEWVATAQITNLPSFSYFASKEAQGTANTPNPSQGRSIYVLSPEKIWDPLRDTLHEYDLDQQFSGFGLVTAEGGVVAKPSYRDGNAVLYPAKGEPSDWTSIERIPRQFITSDDYENKPLSESQLESSHVGDKKFTTNYLSALLEWLRGLLGLDRHCTGSDFPTDALWDGDTTSGDKTKIAEGRYEFDLGKFIDYSDLKNTIRGGHCYMEGDTCKIVPNNFGDSCNPCTPIYEQVPIDPNDLSKGYRNGDLITKDCLRIEYETGEVKEDQRQALIDCINSNNPMVRHYIQPMGFELGGGGYTLETYWKKLQLLTPDRKLCHNKNIGIQVDVEGNLYDLIDDCGAGSGTGTCSGNLVKNPDFSWGMRKPPQTQKGEWSGTPVYWYPFWNPSPPGSADVPVKSPEIKVAADRVADDRGSDGHWVDIFEPQYVQRMEAGIFTEVQFGTLDAAGNPSPFSLPRDTTVYVKARGQGNSGYMGTDYPDYQVACHYFELITGIKEGGSIDKLAGSGPASENFQFSGLTGLSKKVTACQDHSGSNPPGFVDMEQSFTIPAGTQTISIFLGGRATVGDGGSPNKLQVFWDNVCITLPEFPEVVNILPEENAEGYPWEGPGSGGSDYCEPDPPFTIACSFDERIHTLAHKETKHYFPYFGSLVDDMSYLDLQQVAIEPITPETHPEIPLCEDPDSDDAVLCFCEEGQADPLANYLYSIGMLNDNEAQLAGGKKVLAKLKPTEPGGDSGGEPGVTGECTDGSMPLNLPFEGTRYVTQGWYKSGGTHSRIPAHDFGGEFDVLASRGGTIAAIREDSTQGGSLGVPCSSSNFVSIYHEEFGLYTHYVHLKHNSVPDDLHVGDTVPRGKFLGIADNTGCSGGNHLHFNVTASCNDPYYCWNSNYSENYCFAEYPDVNWRDTHYMQVTSDNSRVD